MYENTSHVQLHEAKSNNKTIYKHVYESTNAFASFEQ